MDETLISSLDDPRLAPYRALKERELAREGGRFIAEGEHVVGRLLASDFPVESVLVAARKAARVRPLVRPGTELLVAPEALVHQIVGFKFHSGVMGCGHRKPSPSLDEIMAKPGQRTLVVCPETNNTENLGAMIRLAAALGIDAMLLGELCCDPFYRQTIRVSMGSVFSLPIVISENLDRDLPLLRERFATQLIATVCDGPAEDLAGASRPDRIALLLGNEAQGLSRHHLGLCDRRVMIPMHLGTDSLNVAVAAGIVLYHFMRGSERHSGQAVLR